ncbi:MAG: hypothetical protein O3A01_06220 [bacterium]|nr:hypothetical protein [bacterium]
MPPKLTHTLPKPQPSPYAQAQQLVTWSSNPHTGKLSTTAIEIKPPSPKTGPSDYVPIHKQPRRKSDYALKRAESVALKETKRGAINTALPRETGINYHNQRTQTLNATKHRTQPNTQPNR